jgi:transcriptional regulator with XRE-family HTH domain
MQQSRHLIDVLKRCLRNRNLTYRDVARRLDLSESSVKRIFSGYAFRLDRLEAICALMDMRIIDLCRMAETGGGEDQNVLSLEQEQALAESPPLLTYFYRLLNGWTSSRINREHGIAETTATRYLAHLDRLGLIDLLPENRVRLKVAKHVDWRRSGPLWQRYADAIQRAFYDDGFEGPEDLLEFESGELSAASRQLLRRKIRRLSTEFRELVELDACLPSAQKEHSVLMLATKPWLYSRLFPEQPGQ